MSQSSYVPTPSEIEAACAQIRAGWSEREREKRLRCDWRGGVWRPETIEAVGVEVADDSDL